MKRKVTFLLSILALLCAAGLMIWYLLPGQDTVGGETVETAPAVTETAVPSPSPSASQSAAPAETEAGTNDADDPSVGGDDEDLPFDKLFTDSERKAYQDGQLTLVIPKLDKTLPVYAGVTKDDLRKGVGLYDYARLPGEGNRNVSIAGHRNYSRHGIISDAAPFYYINTLGEGDYLYLADSAHIYRYLWETCYVVYETDWSPIYSQGYSCLTLTSCHPIGVADHRIIVRAVLDQIFDYSADFDYVPSLVSTVPSA